MNIKNYLPIELNQIINEYTADKTPLLIEELLTYFYTNRIYVEDFRTIEEEEEMDNLLDEMRSHMYSVHIDFDGTETRHSF